MTNLPNPEDQFAQEFACAVDSALDAMQEDERSEFLVGLRIAGGWLDSDCSLDTDIVQTDLCVCEDGASLAMTVHLANDDGFVIAFDPSEARELGLATTNTA